MNDPFKPKIPKSPRDVLPHPRIQIAKFWDKDVSPTSKHENSTLKGTNLCGSGMGNDTMKSRNGEYLE